MMVIPQDEIYWYVDKQRKPRLTSRIKTDVLVVGGGMAGISAAHAFAQKKLSVTLVEQYFCGAGASGKSSGFITPDCEIPLRNFMNRVGKEKADHFWQFVTGGVELIRKNIKERNIACSYIEQDSLVVANTLSSLKSEIKAEHDARQEMGYPSNYYTHSTLQEILGSTEYFGGIGYGGTFGINIFAYIQQMADIIADEGVTIYEESPVTSLDAQGATTQEGRIDADYIIVCVDRALPELNKLTSDIYQIQNFLMMSAPMTDKEVNMLFPNGPVMVWDNDLVYSFYRMHSNNQLLLGGGSIFNAYVDRAQYYAPRIYSKLMNYWNKKFPQVHPHFTHMWPGLIGISKDIIPIAGPDPEMPNIYYIAGTAGLPWAAALGNYSAQKLLDGRTDYDEYFKIDRSYPLPWFVQSMIGKKATFALSNLISISR